MYEKCDIFSASYWPSVSVQFIWVKKLFIFFWTAFLLITFLHIVHNTAIMWYVLDCILERILLFVCFSAIFSRTAFYLIAVLHIFHNSIIMYEKVGYVFDCILETIVLALCFNTISEKKLFIFFLNAFFHFFSEHLFSYKFYIFCIIWQ